MKQSSRKKRFGLGPRRISLLIMVGIALCAFISTGNIIFLMIPVAIVIGIVIYTVRRGTYEPQAWRKLATDIGATFSWEGNWGYINANNFKGWTIRLDYYELKKEHGGQSLPTYERRTEMKAPYRSKDDFSFTVDHNINFGSNDEPRADALFAKLRIRELIQCLPSPLILSVEGARQRRELYFTTTHFIKDVEQLRCLFELFVEILNDIGSPKLREMRKTKEKTFVMQVTGAAEAVKFATGAIGVTVKGRVYQGTIQNGDEVEIKGPGRTRRARVFDVPDGLGVPGKEVRLALEGVTETSDVSVGDVVEKV